MECFLSVESSVINEQEEQSYLERTLLMEFLSIKQ